MYVYRISIDGSQYTNTIELNNLLLEDNRMESIKQQNTV